MSGLTSSIPALLTSHPYAVLVLGLLAENAGLPLPGEALIILVAAAASTEKVSLPLAVLAATLGAMLGDNLSYWLGRRGGARVIDRYCQLTLCSRDCGASIASYYRRHGPLAVLLARFVPAVRTLAAPVAGMTGMPWRRFVVLDAVGAFVWAASFTVAGALIGVPLWRALEQVRSYGGWIIGVIVVTVMTTMGLRLLRRRRFGPVSTAELHPPVEAPSTTKAPAHQASAPSESLT